MAIYLEFILNIHELALDPLSPLIGALCLRLHRGQLPCDRLVLVLGLSQVVLGILEMTCLYIFATGEFNLAL